MLWGWTQATNPSESEDPDSGIGLYESLVSALLAMGSPAVQKQKTSTDQECQAKTNRAATIAPSRSSGPKPFQVRCHSIFTKLSGFQLLQNSSPTDHTNGTESANGVRRVVDLLVYSCCAWHRHPVGNRMPVWVLLQPLHIHISGREPGRNQAGVLVDPDALSAHH